MKHYGDLPLKILSRIRSCRLVPLAYTQNYDDIHALLQASGLFDREYYLLANKDVAMSGTDPLMHYVRHGWKEGRNPNLWLDSSFYIEDNPDIADRLTNPLLHFLCAGFEEGRRANCECPKTGRRLILAVLAGDADLNLTLALLNTLPKTELPDGIVVFINPLRLVKRPEAFMELCAFGAKVRPMDDGHSGDAILSALIEYKDDAIVFINPVERPETGWLAAMREGMRKAPTAILANRMDLAILNNNGIELTGYSEDGAACKHIRIPDIDAGVLLPAGFGKNIVRDIQMLQRHAPNEPRIWFAIQSIISGREIVPIYCAIGQFGKDRPIPLETLKMTLCAFRRQLDPLLKTCVAEHAYGARNKYLYESKMKRKIDLANPVTFNEKLQVLKFHEDTELKTIAADKYRAREYIRSVAGSDYLIPLYGVWKHFDHIDFAALPGKFVLKTNHSNSQNMIVLDKSKLNLKKARATFSQWMQENFATVACEMNYFDIDPLIICEEYLGNNLSDYRVMCFNGKPAYICVDTRTPQQIYRNIFTTDWRDTDVSYHYPRLYSEIRKPFHLGLMLDLSIKISQPFTHARCDFYIHPDGRLLIGETTFYFCAGFINFDPDSFDVTLGNLINFKKFNTDSVFE